MGIVKVADSEYYMNDNLIKKWDDLKEGKLKKIDEDRSYVTDGRERSGKSLFTIQQAAYIDPEILEDQYQGEVLPHIPFGNAKSWEEDSQWRREATIRYNEGTLLPQIAFGAKEILGAIRFYKSEEGKTKCIDFDEAFRGMSGKGALSKENKKLTQALMEMGQSNLVLWIVSPSFFLLELYPAMIRSNALFHVQKDKKSKKRVVRIFNYNKKAKLYQIGIRKGWGYFLPTKERTNFYNKYPGGDDFEWRYRLKKQLSLREVGEVEVKEEHKWKKQRDILINHFYSIEKSLRKLSTKLKEMKISISAQELGTIVKQVKEELKNSMVEDGKITENMEEL